MTMRPVNCAVLGSRGLVAQRYLQRLVNHDWFNPVSIIGSSSTVGMNIQDLPWNLDEPRPQLPNITVLGLNNFDALVSELKEKNVSVIFSALPDSIANEVEQPLAERGFCVISHALIHRLKRDVPLVIPDINSDHLKILESQSFGTGSLISCSNCMVVPIALTLYPLMVEYDFSSVNIVTEQSLSGGGRKMLERGRSGLTIDSSIPGESESIISELNRILGKKNEGIFQEANLDVKVWCSRSSHDFGHLATVEIIFSNNISAHEIIEAWQNFSSDTFDSRLPSSSKIINFIDGKLDPIKHRWGDSIANLPDKNLSAGMSVYVGEIEVTGKKLKFKLLSDNTIRGAAGYGVLLAELLLAEEIIQDNYLTNTSFNRSN
ncbi:MAG: aspartate-semialdehyde dehydrogenase [Candidatus Poseidoniales archaeon]|nr:MAG: aspartate-semialdehyde dehydrogenase [Candidatus Poseidoniales archaeon]